MYDITTGTGDFIANGVVSHNCYARRTHEYFGLGAGTDFERKIFIKRDAPELLREAFERRSWKGETVVFSGVTDCYQPLEAAWKLTRGCLEVCLEYCNPLGIITKSLLVRRDVDLLAQLAGQTDVQVCVSIPFWEDDLARIVEPGAPGCSRRFETVKILSQAGVPVAVGVAPVIPGLNDRDIPRLLIKARQCGANSAFHTLLRLPGSVKDVFLHRIRERMPLRARHIEQRILDVRGGKFYDSRFGHRTEGQGAYWETIEKTWDTWYRKVGFPGWPSSPKEAFRRPRKASPQREFLWDEKGKRTE